jgi:aryl-alcohol dehydrogenase-like predicted oxidoreductase
MPFLPSSPSRRSVIAAGAALAASPAWAQAQAGALLNRPILKSGEMLPVIGIGTAVVFDFENDAVKLAERKAVLQNLANGGGKLIDTAPGYGRAEARLGDLFADSGLRPRFFLATKVTATSTRDQQMAQLAASRQRLKSEKFELMQLHNIRDGNTDLGLLREWKAQGICKYIGVTTTSEGAYPGLEELIKRENLDFVQVDYALDNREVENRILPAARDAGTSVLTAQPFGRNRLFARVANTPLPAWAAEIGATSWAQVALKFLIGHPAVTCVIPGTDKPEYMLDNLAAGRGRMPDAALRTRMAAFVDALPAPAGGGGRRG